jgi:tRNA (guanosine-2'-O-)-methyltransferase
MFGPGDEAPLRTQLPSPVGEHALDALLTPERARKYRQVLARRTGRLTVVVEDCYDPHNATAIIRTCDAFGVHRVVVTTGRNAFKVNPKISQGSHFYADLSVFPGIEEAYAALRARGVAIYVSDLAAQAVIGPERLRAQLAERPLALVFGNEGSGVSERASALADGHFLIPMVGFPQSLNLSVSVATSLYALRSQELLADAPGDLSAAEQCAYYDHWVRAHTGRSGAALLAQAVAARETGKQGEELDVFRG